MSTRTASRLTVERRRKVVDFYTTEEELFFLVDPEGVLHFETPEDLAIRAGRPQECLLRLFRSRGDAEVYRDTIELFYPALEVRSSTWSKLWGIVSLLAARCRSVHDAALRVEGSRIAEDEALKGSDVHWRWPEPIDRLRSLPPNSL